MQKRITGDKTDRINPIKVTPQFKDLWQKTAQKWGVSESGLIVLALENLNAAGTMEFVCPTCNHVNLRDEAQKIYELYKVENNTCTKCGGALYED